MVRNAWLLVFFVLLAAPSASAQKLKLDWKETESEHYRMLATCSPEDAQKLLDHLECVYETYCSLLNYDKNE